VGRLFYAHRGRAAHHLAGEFGDALLGHAALCTTRDLSTNSWWVALLTFGEGWHNNHHAHPTVSARHGLTWYEIDMNWYGIWTLKQLGLAWDIKRVRLADLETGLVAAPNGRLVTATLAEGAAAGD
jgi:hypothetical protein